MRCRAMGRERLSQTRSRFRDEERVDEQGRRLRGSPRYQQERIADERQWQEGDGEGGSAVLLLTLGARRRVEVGGCRGWRKEGGSQAAELWLNRVRR